MHIGGKWPVWWKQPGEKVNGFHQATIIGIRPYIGPFDFTHILKLTADTRCGSIEMSVKA